MYNPFQILGVSENVTQNELYEAYKEKRALYSDKRFAPGEEGAEAARKLQEIEEAYNAANDILRSNYDIGYRGDLGKAEEYIKDNRLDEAQAILDSDRNRSAKWHYLQAVIFYKKGWISDSLRQVEFAVSMEPDNQTYRETLENLKRKMNANTGHKDSSFYAGDPQNNQGKTYSQGPMNGATARGCSACDCCSSLICADCCCECMGGDLISCC